jgi:hypothetical protein
MNDASDYVARYSAVRTDLSSPNGSSLVHRRTKQWSRVEHGPEGPRAKAEAQGRDLISGSHGVTRQPCTIACQCVDTQPYRLQLCHCMLKSLSCISDLNSVSHCNSSTSSWQGFMLSRFDIRCEPSSHRPTHKYQMDLRDRETTFLAFSATTSTLSDHTASSGCLSVK